MSPPEMNEKMSPVASCAFPVTTIVPVAMIAPVPVTAPLTVKFPGTNRITLFAVRSPFTRRSPVEQASF
jgi:hypothetical protein